MHSDRGAIQGFSGTCPTYSRGRRPGGAGSPTVTAARYRRQTPGDSQFPGVPERIANRWLRPALFPDFDTRYDELSDGRLRLAVEIPVGAARDVLSVPKDALVQARGGWTVFVAADDQAQPRTVTLGVPLGDRYEVLDGLAPGDLVVVRGNERLRPGQDIAPTILETN